MLITIEDIQAKFEEEVKKRCLTARENKILSKSYEWQYQIILKKREEEKEND